MSWLYVLVGVAIALLLVKLLTKKSTIAAIPGPPTKWPFFGHYFDILWNETGVAHLKWSALYGPFVRYNMLGFERILVTDSAAVKQVLLNSHTFDKALPQYSVLGQLLGRGLVTETDESIHKYHRSIIFPAFALKWLKAMVPIFQHKGALLVEDWLKAAESGKPTPIKDDIAKATSDAIGEAAFGYSLNSQRSDTAASIYNIFADLITRGFSPFELFPVVKYFVPNAYRRKKAVNVLNEQVNTIYSQKIKGRENRPKKEIKKEEEDDDVAAEKRDLLDILIDCENEEGARLTREELLDETKTFLLAGYETSSVCILWTLQLLAKNPEIQTKVANEIISVIGKERAPTAEDILDKMPYLNKVIKESLRIRPPIPLVVRRAAEDVKLGPYDIPKGMAVVISIYHQHHNPRVWKNPDVFDPERFSNEEEEHAKLLGSYVPFIMGPRNCIGQRFAMLEVRVILAMVLQKLQVASYGPEPIKKAKVSMVPKHPLYLIFSKRQ